MGILLGVSGLAGVGKDTAANFMVERFDFVKISFADPLKRICRDVFDFSEEQLWGPSEMRNRPDKRYLRPAGFSYPFTASGSIWIPLTKGEHALIDEQDFDRVAASGPWCVVEKGHGKRTKYAKARIDGNDVKLHQFITGESGIDHINGNGLDNRRVNLRIANDSQNHANMLPQLGGSSPFKGVTFDKSRNKWSAKITVDSKTINLGRFDNEHEAATAYDLALRENFGEFARTNTDAFLTPRYALQQLGTEFGRNCYENVWVEYALRLSKTILENPTKFDYTNKLGLYPADRSKNPVRGVVIADCRFGNEVGMLIAKGGKLLRLKRPGAGLSGAAGTHASEKEQQSIPDDTFNYVVDNDGTIEDLNGKLFKIFNPLLES